MNLDKINQLVGNLDREKVMEIMKKLINIDTSTPPGNTYREYVDAISTYFKDLGYNLEEIIVPEELIKEIPYPLEGPRINLVATKDFGQKSYISFYGHMDVAPAPEDGFQKWRFPPFNATMIKSGKIYGRGVADMKGSMVCLILALQLIDKLNLKPKFNIRVLNCTDEEIGFYPGVRYLAEQGYVKGTLFSMDYLIDPVLIIGAAGELEIDVETIGRSAHSGVSYLGVNALEEMIPILAELMELKKQIEQRESKDIPGVPELKTGKIRNMTPLFNLDIIKAGKKYNIIPDICKLTIDRRILPDENYNEVKQEILEAIERGKEKSKALDVKIEFKYSDRPLKVDLNTPEIQRIIKVIGLVYNVPKERIRKLGMSITFDTGFVAQILNTNNFIIRGVMNTGSNPHGVNETIKLKDVKAFIKELIIFLCADL